MEISRSKPFSKHILKKRKKKNSKCRGTKMHSSDLVWFNCEQSSIKVIRITVLAHWSVVRNTWTIITHHILLKDLFEMKHTLLISIFSLIKFLIYHQIFSWLLHYIFMLRITNNYSNIGIYRIVTHTFALEPQNSFW
jgi:hypothetical protein